MRSKLSHAILGLFIVGVTLFTGCASDEPLAQQVGNSDAKDNYIAGDGSVLEIRQPDRGERIDFTGSTFDGDTISAETLEGPTLINFWYAACAPCRVEAPHLADLSQEFDEVNFVGVNVRDEKAEAAHFEQSFGIQYPSIEDRSGQVLAEFADYAPPQAVPTTVILDDQGRVAARILGAIDPSTVEDILSKVVSE
ncbi:MAG TPA: TlpA family protein disulfide reductase [Enteractinococcus helveticum]|uniref:TlpA family protein disulfide reductase n=1 Tax=Enteractinococcus helveticum TaxID=1837282 RepID=A0A921FN33_9MICC|nr:TlpA disulfide reductase family protein [Enteractinococcus helveticum]HJF13766.1 TlpA family protein disulfide reductase [Enteractinococcus helveticum]